mgnify:FL=1
MSKTTILSIHAFGHDTSASLMIDGEIVSACEQERYTGDKHSKIFPIDAVNDCLLIGGVKIDDVDLVVIPYLPDVMIRERYLKSALESDIRLEFLKNDLNYVKQFFNIEEDIKSKLSYSGRVEFLEHHMCHLSSSYYSSGFNDPLVVSYDGLGEIDTMAIAIVENGKLVIKENNNQYPHSLGLMYSAVTHYLGWKSSYDEGIVMGLASLGDSSAKVPGKDISYLEVFEKIAVIKSDFIFELSFPDYMNFYEERDVWVGGKFIDYFGSKRGENDDITQHHMNIAAGLQDRMQDIIVAQLKAARKKYNKNRLCISGGVGLNCSMNGKIASLGIFDEIFVIPPAGDPGTTIGACYLGNKMLGNEIKIKKRFNFYLGSRFDSKEILEALNDSKLDYYKPRDIYSDTAERLQDGKIIAWFQGASEFGPRALGNRSILAKPYPLEMKDYVNSRVKFREEFRPFAPAVLKEFCSDFFDIKQESPHMLIAVEAKHENKNKIAATVHSDNSSRVQTVGKNDNLRFWNLLNSFYDKTGVPVLLNTSFNVKGQPVVNSPVEAINTLQSTNIDCLVIGDFIVDSM